LPLGAAKNEVTVQGSTQELLSRLAKGPAFLFLGQSSIALSSAAGVPSSSNESEGGEGEAAHLPAIGDEADDAVVAFYEATERAMRSTPAPEWLKELAGFPWNGVFTTRIDSALGVAFDASWRRVVPTAQVQLGRHPRSSTQLQLRYLFGGMGLPEDERPPRDAFEDVSVRARAAETLAAVASTLITPRGVFVIEGYSASDWLAPKDLFTFLSRLEAGQAHLFSVSPELQSDPFIKRAVERGLLATYRESLAWTLAEAVSAGRLHTPLDDLGTHRRLIPIGDGFVEVDISTWNRVIGTARAVDTELLEPFTSASTAMKYQRFRTFLGASEGSPPWKAIASGYKLSRDFETTLQRTVVKALEESSLPGPVILQGQTATGKTVALCALAQEIARSGQAAVLHQSRRGDRPTLSEIDAFAVWAESQGAPSTLLVWDGMVDPDEYFALQRQLRSRGRRLLIVGSSYLTPDRSPSSVIAGAQLTSDEARRAKSWLKQFGISMPSMFESGSDTSFLALLYRLLPDTERGLRQGLALEMRAAESGLERLARSAEQSDTVRLTAVAQALAAAGFNVDELTPSERPHAELIALSLEERSSAERLTSIILVAGMRGLLIPLEVALRTIGKDGSSRLVELIRHFDIFRWSEDDAGEQFLGARTRLEAELLAKQDLSPETEIEIVAEMIHHLRPTDDRWGGIEVQFIVDLVETVGPQSQESGRYAAHYLNLADAFRTLRQNLGWSHHRLVLQEANLTREYAQWAQRKDVKTSEERLALLHDVQRLLESTIEEADASGRAKLNLLVELASTVGAQLFILSVGDSEPEPTHVAALMNQVMNAALEARAYDPENIYPVDVVAWTTERALQTQVLGAQSRLELLANAVASLDSVDPETLSPRQRAQYDQRQMAMGRLLNDPTLEAKHLQSLLENDDPAAYYFLARSAAQKGSEGLEVAVRTLQDAPVEVRSDWRCSRLLVDLFWQLKTGKRFLKGQREVLPFNREDWNECLRLAEAIPSAATFDEYRLEFLRGLALFHLGAHKQSAAVFQKLDRDSVELSNRIISTYLASTPEGEAQLFTGRVTWASPDGRRGTAWVDQLGIEVNFIPHRFSISDYKTKGDILPSFHIAFNMRGALADPVRGPYRTEGRAIDAR
jgi:hypothetical protein